VLQVLATLAHIWAGDHRGVGLPDEAGEDSFSMLPLWRCYGHGHHQHYHHHNASLHCARSAVAAGGFAIGGIDAARDEPRLTASTPTSTHSLPMSTPTSTHSLPMSRSSTATTQHAAVPQPNASAPAAWLHGTSTSSSAVYSVLWPARPHSVSCSMRNVPSLRLGAWKLILGRGSGGWTRAHEGKLPEQLYNLDADPGEATDLAASEPLRVAQMRTLLLDEVVRSGRSRPRLAQHAEHALHQTADGGQGRRAHATNVTEFSNLHPVACRHPHSCIAWSKGA
jgi:hypothetical protein